MHVERMRQRYQAPTSNPSRTLLVLNAKSPGGRNFKQLQQGRRKQSRELLLRRPQLLLEEISRGLAANECGAGNHVPEYAVGAAEDGEGGLRVLRDVGGDLVEERRGEGLGRRLGFIWRDTHGFDGSGGGMVCLWNREIVLEQSQ